MSPLSVQGWARYLTILIAEKKNGQEVSPAIVYLRNRKLTALPDTKQNYCLNSIKNSQIWLNVSNSLITPPPHKF